MNSKTNRCQKQSILINNYSERTYLKNKFNIKINNKNSNKKYNFLN